MASIVLAGAVPLPAGAVQSLEDRLDEVAFLDGLVRLELPELLEHYITTHPSTDPIRQAAYGIAAAELRMRVSPPGSAERQAVLEQVLHLRRAAIDLHRDHAGRSVWMADQAADLFFELLPVDASGLTSLFGLPSPEQHRRGRRVAAAMNSLMEEAELEVERAILAIETRPGYRDDEALRMRRRRLAGDERDRRIPFLRGVGAFLQAELGGASGPRRRELYALAADALEPLDAELPEPLAVQVRLYRGLALARLGRFAAAEALLTAVIDDEASHVTLVFAAGMGRVLNRVEQEGPRAGLVALEVLERDYAGAEGLFFRVLIVDRRFDLRRRIALASEGVERREGMRRAFAAYLELLHAAKGAGRASLRAVVFGRLAAAAGDEAPLAELPVIVTVARAERLAGDAPRRREAIDLLRGALERPDAEPKERAAALLALGRALYADDQRMAAVHRLTALAREHPLEPESLRAIELAASIASTALRRNPGDAQTRAALGDALEVIFASYPELSSIDRWRYEAGRLALAGGDFADAIAGFERIPIGTPLWLDAQFMEVAALRAAASAEQDARERRRLNTRVVAAAGRGIEHLLPAAATAEAGRRADLHYYAAQLRVLAAEALVDMNNPRAALARVADIEDAPGVLAGEGDGEPGIAGSGVLAAALQVRIRADQLLGRPDDARREIDRILVAAPDQAGDVLASMLVRLLGEIDGLVEAGHAAQARERAEREAVPLGRRLEEWAAGTRLEPRRRATMLERAALAYRAGGRFDDALRVYEALGRDMGDSVEVVFGRAECLFGKGGAGDGDAMRLYKRVIAGGPDLGSRAYWQSHLRVLQILDRVERNTSKIVPRIQRLRLQDPDLGGDRLRREFEKLEAKYG